MEFASELSYVNPTAFPIWRRSSAISGAIVEDAVPAAQQQSPFREGTPRESDPRREIVLVRIDQASGECTRIRPGLRRRHDGHRCETRCDIQIGKVTVLLVVRRVV